MIRMVPSISKSFRPSLSWEHVGTGGGSSPPEFPQTSRLRRNAPDDTAFAESPAVSGTRKRRLFMSKTKFALAGAAAVALTSMLTLSPASAFTFHPATPAEMKQTDDLNAQA